MDFALECARIIERFNGESNLNLSLRAGIDSGRVSSGQAEPIFDMWGRAVNLAHRIKTTVPEPGIFVSSRVYDVLADTMTFTPAGSIDVNGVSEPIWRLEDSQ